MRELIFLIVLVLFSITLRSQDLFCKESSIKYADFLMASGQYSLAVEEFERLIFLDSNEIEFKNRLLVACNKSKQYSRGITAINTIYNSEIYRLPQEVSLNYLKLLYSMENNQEIDNFLLKSESISTTDKILFENCNLLLNINKQNFKPTIATIKKEYDYFPDQFKTIFDNTKSIKFKNPALAGGLSTIIPGAGKFYAGKKVDGIFSLIFVAGNAWQSYRGFKKKGISSAKGWIFGSISLGFYISNIYGSVKAVKKYNDLKSNFIKSDVQEFIQYYNN